MASSVNEPSGARLRAKRLRVSAAAAGIVAPATGVTMCAYVDKLQSATGRPVRQHRRFARTARIRVHRDVGLPSCALDVGTETSRVLGCPARRGDRRTAPARSLHLRGRLSVQRHPAHHPEHDLRIRRRAAESRRAQCPGASMRRRLDGWGLREPEPVSDTAVTRSALSREVEARGPGSHGHDRGLHGTD